MRSKKLISIVSALAMILSLFTAFTVAQAADTAEMTAEILESGTKAGETVKIKFAYKGLNEDNATLGAIGFCLPLDETVFDVTSLKSESNYTGAVMGYNDATKVYSFSYTTITPVKAVANDLSTVTLTLLKDLDTNYVLSDLTEIILTSLNTSDYSEYTYENVKTPEILLNKYESATKITGTVLEAGTKAGETVKIKFAYEGLDENNATLGAIGFCLPLDETVFDVTSLKSESNYTGAVMGYNDATKVYSFSYTTITPVKAVANDLSTITLTLLKDIETPYTFSNITEIILTSLNTSDYSEYTYEDVSTPAIVIGSTGGDSGDDKPPVTDEEYAVTVSVSPKKGGTATADADKAKAGATVTVTYEANDGYELDKITVNGDEIEAANGKATFTMPAAEAKVVVKFTEEAEEDTVKEYVLNVTKSDKGNLGQAYDIKVTGNADYAGTAHEKFDIVVTMFDDDNVAIGYMIYNDVTVDSDISVCAVETKGSIAVNLVDDFTADNMGTVLAKRATAK